METIPRKPALLVRDYQRWRYWKGISLDDSVKEGPYFARITHGFEEYFGPGKSPFMPMEMLMMDDMLYVLVDTANFRHNKWRYKLAVWSDAIGVIFYDMHDKSDAENWRKLSCEFDKAMQVPIWIALKDTLS